MAQWIVENWFLIVALAAGAGSIAYAIYKFAGLPTEQQVKNIKEWLLLAVTTAEKELGGGTGQLRKTCSRAMWQQESLFPVIRSKRRGCRCSSSL